MFDLTMRPILDELVVASALIHLHDVHNLSSIPFLGVALLCSSFGDSFNC